MTRLLLIVLLVVSASCGDPTEPSLPGARFTISGSIGGSCNLINASTCPVAPFGTGVASGTAFSGHFLLDSAAKATDVVTTATSTSARFHNVIVDLTIGDVTLKNNDIASTYVQVEASMAAHTYTIVLPHGFSSGVLGGLTVDYAEITLPIVPSRYPDITPPRDLAAFQPAIQLKLGSVVMLKHSIDTSLGLGQFSPGSLLFAAVTGIQ